jgi:hypothetical protein
VAELLRFGVWEFDEESPHHDETWVVPVRALPVSDISGRVVATMVRLAGGVTVPAILGNIDLRKPASTYHFRGLSIIADRADWFHLARYHDLDYDSRGPEALARFLGLPLSAVFPITYDLSNVAVGDVQCVAGTITAEPAERLTKAELIAMAIS